MIYSILFLALLNPQALYPADTDYTIKSVKAHGEPHKVAHGKKSPLPTNFAFTTFPKNCVGSMEGHVFNQVSDKPVAYLSTLMLKTKSRENDISSVRWVQRLLRDSIQLNACTDAEGVHTALEEAFCNIYDHLWEHFKKGTAAQHRYEMVMRYACTGHIYVFTPDETYITYLKDPFKPSETQIARDIDEDDNYPDRLKKYGDTIALLIKRFENGSETIEEVTKIIGGMLESKETVTLISRKSLGPKFPKLDKCYFLEMKEQV